MAHANKMSPRTEWAITTAVLAGAILLGFGLDQSFFRWMAIGSIWFIVLVMAFTLSPSFYLTVVFKMAKEQGPRAPLLALVAIDLALAVLMAKHGYPGTAAMLTVAMLRSIQIRFSVNRMLRALEDEGQNSAM